ncbi:unnamed protein product [Durusdinium trenchii]|uniref:Uncharacterized protein n=1 Tax=Durusdinium trenchii TaxID=1381693 RepID=A0ABP0RZZ2_9DINO
MSMTSISTAYSGIDSPGTAILQIVGRLTKHYGLQVNHPHHLFAVEWERSCQHELCVHPGSADCIFGDIADFLHPLVRSQLPELQKNNQLTSVLMPVVRDTPTKAILMDAWCVKHGKTCSVQDKIADVHVAGTTCCAFSAIGDGQGESAMSHAHFLVWCGQRAVLQEPIIIQENVVAFPREALMLMLPMYEWVFGVLDPVQLGWPIRRERQFMMTDETKLQEELDWACGRPCSLWKRTHGDLKPSLAADDDSSFEDTLTKTEYDFLKAYEMATPQGIYSLNQNPDVTNMSEAFYQANEAPDREDYPNLLTTAKYGLDVLIFDHRTPQSVLQFLITYHNAFHQGAETSFMEMIMKVPEVEKAWANYKVANGISSRQSDYESKYREMLTSQFPATWTSFRHFEATRQVYNVLSKLNCLVELKTFISDHCDFLHNELTHDTVVFVMKEVLTALPTVFNIMADSEKQALCLEALYMCVPLNISEIPWLLRRSASAGQEIALVLTAVDGKVFETQRKMRVQKEKRKGQKNPQQVLSENLVAKKAKEEKAAIAAAKAKAKGKCKPKAAAAKNNLNEELADDTTKESQSVTLTDTGGIAVSRPKLFADCLVLCIRSAITAARTKYGLAQGVEEESLVPDSAADPIKYTDAEINIIRPAVRAGLIFAIQGSHMFNGKVYKKWSALRPALQCHLMEAYKKAS